jgi:hypothetical protein
MENCRFDLEMPKYRCHKEVWALKIDDIITVENKTEDDEVFLRFEDERYGDLQVSSEYVNKHKPKYGGYFVVYADGYESWSPAEAFEAGYTRID